MIGNGTSQYSGLTKLPVHRVKIARSRTNIFSWVAPFDPLP